MRLQRIRLVIRADGKPRRIMSFTEHPRGDVYIRLHSGAQVNISPDHILVKQHKYSIHVSPKSRNYTTLKKTFVTSDKKEIITSCLTDAVKQRTGFCPVFHTRFSDLSASHYDVKPDLSYNTMDLGEYEPNKNTLVVGLLVTSKRKLVPSQTASIRCAVKSFKSTHFQFVVLYSLTITPSTPFAWTMDRVTLPPELAKCPDTRLAIHESLKGKSFSECETIFQQCFIELIKRQFDDLINLPTSDRNDLAAIEKLKLIRSTAPESPFVSYEDVKKSIAGPS